MAALEHLREEVRGQDIEQHSWNCQTNRGILALLRQYVLPPKYHKPVVVRTVTREN